MKAARERDRAEAHYRWAGRYTERGNTGKAIAHFGRAREIEEQSQVGFGGLMKDFRGLFSTKGGGTEGRPVPPTSVAEVPAREEQQRYNGKEDKLKLFERDEQAIFAYAERAYHDLMRSAHIASLSNPMSIGLERLENGIFEVFLKVGDDKESEKLDVGKKTGYSLRFMGVALDTCAKRLQDKGLIDAEHRLFLQRDVMAHAYINFLRHVEKAASGM